MTPIDQSESMEHSGKIRKRIPLLERRGVCAHQLREMRADGVVDQQTRSHRKCLRSTPFESVRCAVIYMDAARRYQPPRLAKAGNQAFPPVRLLYSDQEWPISNGVHRSS